MYHLGMHIMQAIYKSEDENRGILQTGDIGYQDTDGFSILQAEKADL